MEIYLLNSIIQISRVGHRVLFRSERIVLLCSFKERNVLLHSFFEFLVTYETQKNDAFSCVLLCSFLISIYVYLYFYIYLYIYIFKKRTQRSFAMKVKERRERFVLLQRT